MTTMTTAPAPTTLTDEQLEAIKTKQQATWASGDFAVIGTTLQIAGELLARPSTCAPVQRVLDVAAGNGNAALAAARRDADVTATDYVPALLEAGATRAPRRTASGALRGRDAEALPFADASFDAVLSIFGVMFVARPERAAAELVRVCRPGAASASPTGRPAASSATCSAPSAGTCRRRRCRRSSRGATRRWSRLLGPAVELTSVRRHEFVFRYMSARDFVDTFRTYYGPTHRAFAVLDASGRQALEDELLALAESANRSAAGALAVPSEYLEVVASRS